MIKFRVLKNNYGVEENKILYSNLEEYKYGIVKLYKFYSNSKSYFYLPLSNVEEIKEEKLIGKYVELVGKTLRNYEKKIGKEKCTGGVFGYIIKKYDNLEVFKIDVKGTTIVSEKDGFKVVSTLIDDEISNVVYDMLNLQVPNIEKVEFKKVENQIKISKKTEKLVKEIELWHIENAIDKSLENGDYLSIPKLIESRRLLEQR